MQFDLFEYSRDTGMRHDVLNALERFEAPAAQLALAALMEVFPHDAALPDMAGLLDVLGQRDAALFASHDAAAEASARLHDLETAALLMFGRDSGRAWLRRLWREAATRAARLPFSPKASRSHAAPLFLRACDWQAAADAVATIPSWRRIPAPLGWMAQVHYRQGGLDAAWPLLCELAWIAPSRFDELCTRLADPMIASLLKKFHAGFEGNGDAADLAWFPAWALVENAALADAMHDVQASRDSAAERAALTLRELLGLERRGQHQAIVERRKRLQGLQASLYAAYMKTR
jgi:hypothetical protein